MNYFSYIFFLLVLCFIGCSSPNRMMRFSIDAVDEQDAHLPNVGVSVFIKKAVISRRAKDTTVFRGEPRKYRPLRVQAKGLGLVAALAQKDGFYDSQIEYAFRNLNRKQTMYTPVWKPFQVKMLEVRSPRALYAHFVDWTSLPIPGPVGFDLELGDWVAPHGRGETVDFLFTGLMEKKKDPLDELTQVVLSFPNEFDGIQVINRNSPEVLSSLLLGRKAPDFGYEKTFARRYGGRRLPNDKWESYDAPTTEDAEAVEGCWFRVRSRMDPISGEIRARHGKIQGLLRIGHSGRAKTPSIRFAYYLAPDEAPSLEFSGESLVPNANLQTLKRY